VSQALSATQAQNPLGQQGHKRDWNQTTHGGGWQGHNGGRNNHWKDNQCARISRVRSVIFLRYALRFSGPINTKRRVMVKARAKARVSLTFMSVSVELGTLILFRVSGKHNNDWKNAGKKDETAAAAAPVKGSAQLF